MPNSSAEVVIVGAGLAGLSCARKLAREGVAGVEIIEASDDIGGRVRTDVVDGFRLDRGFQVFLNSYPEARSTLEFDDLDLQQFRAGAIIRTNGRALRLFDPSRHVTEAIGAAVNPVMTVADKARVRALASELRRATTDELLSRSENSTIEYLRAKGFSDTAIERFFRPFFGGVFCEKELATSARMFEFTFRMFATGEAAVPGLGMQEIPRQLASRCAGYNIRLNTHVVSIDGTDVITDRGRVSANCIVIAVDAPVARQLVGDLAPEISTRGSASTTLYFAAEKSPVGEPSLVLDGDNLGPINSVAVMSDVSPAYAPAGAALISAAVVGNPPVDDQTLTARCREQLKQWFGDDVLKWRHLRTYRIPFALPEQTPSAILNPQKRVRLKPGLFICGDHRDQGSIDGAMVSGRRCAEAVLDEIS